MLTPHAVRVVHFSDWHGEFQPLPEADLYVCTGDMLPDKWYRRIPALEVEEQLQYLDTVDGPFRELLGSPHAPVVCVRGNHDYVDLAGLFAGCNLMHEFVDNELVEVCGLRITGHRGTPWINGYFSDEFDEYDLLARARRMPEADLVLTHYPPYEILDEGYGLRGLREVLSTKLSARGRHLFGHIHECGGQAIQKFSNAATTFNVLEIVC